MTIGMILFLSVLSLAVSLMVTGVLASLDLPNWVCLVGGFLVLLALTAVRLMP